ncbi:MAG: DUF192 domain-containing protein [Acidimicrobiales bacterium]|nr:DUF192 domain-containing protein [Acidimicrobiales bacterium]
MPWLLRDDKVLASVEVADSRSARRRGLLGRDGFEGVLLFEGTRSVHSVGMRFPIDVAFCDADMHVIKTMRVVPHRITVPVWSARHVLEAEAGSFARWGLTVGDQLEIRGEHPDH